MASEGSDDGTAMTGDGTGMTGERTGVTDEGSSSSCSGQPEGIWQMLEKLEEIADNLSSSQPPG